MFTEDGVMETARTLGDETIIIRHFEDMVSVRFECISLKVRWTSEWYRLLGQSDIRMARRIYLFDFLDVVKCAENRKIIGISARLALAWYERCGKLVFNSSFAA